MQRKVDGVGSCILAMRISSKKINVLERGIENISWRKRRFISLLSPISSICEIPARNFISISHSTKKCYCKISRIYKRYCNGLINLGIPVRLISFIAYAPERSAKTCRDHVDHESSPTAIVDHIVFTFACTHMHACIKAIAVRRCRLMLVRESGCWQNRLISEIPAIKVPSPSTAIARDLPVMCLVR